MHGDTNQTVDLRQAGHRTAARPYYEALNKACDAIVRCTECGRLVTHATLIGNEGLTPCCGAKRVREVRTLTAWEWLRIRLGLMDFPYRKEFLAEFATRAR